MQAFPSSTKTVEQFLIAARRFLLLHFFCSWAHTITHSRPQPCQTHAHTLLGYGRVKALDENNALFCYFFLLFSSAFLTAYFLPPLMFARRAAADFFFPHKLTQPHTRCSIRFSSGCNLFLHREHTLTCRSTPLCFCFFLLLLQSLRVPHTHTPSSTQARHTAILCSGDTARATLRASCFLGAPNTICTHTHTRTHRRVSCLLAPVSQRT